MSSFLRFSLAAAALLFASVQQADAAASTSAEVTCFEAMDDICVGFAFITSPSPGELCVDPDDETTCEIIYEGGYSWTYTFIEGYEEGTDLTEEDPEEVAAAETGLEVTVTMNDDLSACEITVGNETCASCSTAGCSNFTVTYDCLNIDMGSMSMDCVEVEPIFYPLELGEIPMDNVTFPESPTTNDEVGEPMTNDEPQPEPFVGGESSASAPSFIASAFFILASGLFAL